MYKLNISSYDISLVLLIFLLFSRCCEILIYFVIVAYFARFNRAELIKYGQDIIRFKQHGLYFNPNSTTLRRSDELSLRIFAGFKTITFSVLSSTFSSIQAFGNKYILNPCPDLSTVKDCALQHVRIRVRTGPQYILLVIHVRCESFE